MCVLENVLENHAAHISTLISVCISAVTTLLNVVASGATLAMNILIDDAI